VTNYNKARRGFIANIAKTEVAWNKESQFWPEWNGLEWKKLVLALLEFLGMEEVGFGLTEMAWNRGSLFWPFLNAWNIRSLFLPDINLWLKMAEVISSLTGMAWNEASPFWPDCNGLERRKSVLA
jgi:hypothetical protein